MKKSASAIDFTQKAPLIDRQRNLWAISDHIDQANYNKKPLSEDVAHWLFMALRNIALGEDANEVFDVLPEKRGVRKNGFKLEFERNMAISNVAAARKSNTKLKTKTAISEASNKLMHLKESTVRKQWNSSTAERDTGFTPSKK